MQSFTHLKQIYSTLERPTPQFGDGGMTHITFAVDLVAGEEGCNDAKACAGPGYPKQCCPYFFGVCACCNCKYVDHAGTILVPLEM